VADVVEHLIDVSVFNAVNDWNAVHANGIVGASVKVSQAANYLNPACAAQVQGARRAGVIPGGYHFGDPRVAPEAQARFFAMAAQPLGLFAAEALAPMFDAENWAEGGLVWSSRAQLTDHICGWAEFLRDNNGVTRGLVYGSLSWWGSMLAPSDWDVAGFEFLNWVAVYNGDPGNLQGWSNPNDVLHQHTSDGIVPGISARVDKNVTLRGRVVADLLNEEDGDMAVSQEDFDALRSSVDRILEILQVSDKSLVVGGGPGKPETVHDIVERGIDTTQACHDDLKADVNRVIEAITNLELNGGATDDQVERVMRTSGLFSDFVRKGQPVSLRDAVVPDPHEAG